jgi:HEAT repeat protein
VIDVQRALRTMKIVSALQVSMHIQPLLLKLMRFTHPQLRSKATLLFCQLNRNPQWAERKLSDEDGRIRANIIEGLWGVAEARDVLCEALRDGNHRVAANALIGLYHLDGIAAVAAPLEAMGSSLKFLYRSTAAFAMGQTADPHFLPLLTEMAKDPNVKVRGMALRALVRIRKRAAEQQRAAVAAEAEPQQPEVQVEVPSEPVEATVPAAPLPAESIST